MEHVGWRRFPGVVTAPLPSWRELVQRGAVLELEPRVSATYSLQYIICLFTISLLFCSYLYILVEV